MSNQLAGREYLFDLGELQVRYRFDSAESATFTVVNGAGLAPDGHTETVDITVKELRSGLYLNSWREESGATVTHVEDFANGVLYSNVTVDGQIYTFVGSIKEA
ncbi:MoaF-related domain-containing protein [Planotetraspora kaengkrachanensis]|uniref:MoaF-like domain-containing protein n=1 Tax=Planotetraspora kaengkrachanensis TaxID=575193 RepID=A0A8J3PS38_9ACTN|nr:hypothetical protein [Planotetraspora kaengkrachanensis]GIG79039.1 hypothetical protein Pka01_21660 [Planotetraspora kaengkrachanensis]